MRYFKTFILACTLFAFGCARGPMGEVGPMGPSGGNGNPGQDYSSYTTALAEHFDGQSDGASPAGWTITPSSIPGQEITAAVSSSTWTSPGRSLRLSAPVNCAASAVVPFNCSSSQKLRASFDLYRAEAAPDFAVRSFRVLVVAAGYQVADLFFGAGPGGDEVLLVYNGGQVNRPLGSRSYFDRFQVDYDPATGLTDVSLNGSPLASRLPVKAAAGAMAGSSSYVRFKFTTQAPLAYSLDEVIVQVQ